MSVHTAICCSLGSVVLRGSMRIPYYQVDAFTARTFGGNPGGVCVLESWLPDDTTSDEPNADTTPRRLSWALGGITNL